MAGDEHMFLSSSEQEKLLEDSTKLIKTEAFEMKRCLDKGVLMDAIKHASQMLGEMRTGSLTPKYYYRLYVDITNELQHLEAHLSEEFEKGRQVAELYELVQYAGNVVPRMYLLITIGVVYIKSREAHAKTILKDLVEMCRGVQHPLRGLFLRNYLLQSTRNLLPDMPAESNDENGNVKDAIDFIMINFSEMNKLWVRMQHQGPSREKDKRERERRELRILVGTNLVRLSQLTNINIQTYQNTVLPGILEQSVSCKDPISQEYLMECVIQVFPDEYHLSTLHEFLNACNELHQSVQVKNVFIALIDRLAIYASCEGCEIPSDLPLFNIFSKQIESAITSRMDMPPEDIVALHIALLNFALKCYSENTDFANIVLESTSSIFSNLKLQRIKFGASAGRELLKLLRIPVEQYHDADRLLKLTSYKKLIDLMDYRGRSQACCFVLNDLVENDLRITNEESVNGIFELVETFLIDQEDQPDDVEQTEDFIDEQCLIAKIVNLLQAETHEQHFIFLNSVRKRFGAGGKHRIKYTLPTVIYCCLQLIVRYAEDSTNDEKRGAKLQKMLLFCMNTITALVTTAEMTHLPLNLYLHGALVADKANFNESSTIAYEFISKAFSVYEESVASSREQLMELTLIIGTLQKIRCFTEENHSPLRSHCALASAKLLKKADQCVAICSVAHLFWSGYLYGNEDAMKDGEQVLICLKKAARVSSQCMEPLIQIRYSISVLNHYLYFFENNCKTITIEVLNNTISKVRETIIQLESSSENHLVTNYFALTLKHVKDVTTDEESDIKYDGISF